MSAACITTHIWKYSSSSDSLVCMVNCSLQFLLRAAELGLLHGGPPLVYESSSACCSWVTSARFTPLSGSQKAPKDPRTRRKKHNNSERVTDLKVKARRTPAIRMTATHQKHDHSGRCPCRTCRPLHPWWPRRCCHCCRLQTPPACSQGGSSSWASQAWAGGVLWLKQVLSYDHLSSASS